MASISHTHPHPGIDGEPGELMGLLMELIDRSHVEYPYWWFDYGSLAGARVGIGLPQGVDRSRAMDALRDAMARIVAEGLDEAFLVRALKADLDEFVDRAEHTAGYDAKIEEARQQFLQIIKDPAARDGWRRARGVQEPEWLDKSDEEVIADAHAAYESFGKKFTTADQAAARWASAVAWREISSQLLPDVIYEHWSNLRTRRSYFRQRDV